MITAKVLCNLRQEFGHGEAKWATVGFAPDYLSGANREWAQATPHLDLRMTVTGAVLDRFFPGKSYTLQFIEED